MDQPHALAPPPLDELIFEQDLAERLEAHLIDTGSLSRREADLARIQRMASSVLMTKRAERDLDFALRVRTDAAIGTALRELQRLQDQEDQAISMAVLELTD